MQIVIKNYVERLVKTNHLIQHARILTGCISQKMIGGLCRLMLPIRALSGLFMVMAFSTTTIRALPTAFGPQYS